MPADAKGKVFALLDEMRIPYQVTHHPAVYTIEDMENLEMEHIDRVMKNLFVRDDKKRNYYLLTIPKDKHANMKEVQDKIGSRRLSLANEDDLGKYLGLNKGEVTPFGALNDLDNAVTIIMDNALKEYEFIGVHPNDNTATVWISPDDLIKVLKSVNHKVLFISV